jgi:hypothetical protein
MMIRRALKTQALVLALAPLAAQAQTAPPPPAQAAPAATPEAAPQIDPARMAAARVTVDHIFPLGTYARLMGAPMDKMMQNLMGGMGQMPVRELAAMSGANAAELAKLNKTTVNDIMAIYDPAYQQRMTIVMHTMIGQMSGLMSQIEPGIREGLAQAYANRFTADQLADMNRFFDTPSGHAYADNAMALQMDPAVMAKMQGFMPMMVKQMPEIMKKVEEATATLPKPRKWQDMTPAQRKELARLLGVTESQMDAHARATAQAPAKTGH